MKTRVNLSVLSGLGGVCMFFSASLIQADAFIQAKRHTDSFTMMGQTTPAKDEVVTTWMSKDKYRIDGAPGQSFIVRLAESKIHGTRAAAVDGCRAPPCGSGHVQF